MTTPDIAGLCERLRAAREGVTPGVGYAPHPDDNPSAIKADQGCRAVYIADIMQQEDRAFIALSREAVPALLDTIERQTAEIKRLNATCYLDSFMASERKVERQAAEIERLRGALKRSRRYVADLPIVGDADLAVIDAALTGEDAGGKG